MRIGFFELFPITGREMDLKLKKGLPALVTALADGEVRGNKGDIRAY